MFRFIVRLVGSDLAKVDTNMHKALLVEKRIAVAFWRWATGVIYRSTFLEFSVGRTSTLKAEKEFCKILPKKAGEFIKCSISGHATITTSQHFSSKKEQSQVTHKNILIFDKK